jgi:hypothetical protein
MACLLHKLGSHDNLQALIRQALCCHISLLKLAFNIGQSLLQSSDLSVFRRELSVFSPN